MASSVVNKLVAGSQLTGSNATYYTAPVNTRVTITQVTLTNTTATPRTVNLFLVPSGGSAGVTNQLLINYPVPAYSTKAVASAVGHVMLASGFLQAAADAATAITLQVSGVEVVTGS